jgi:hypothetical protein
LSEHIYSLIEVSFFHPEGAERGRSRNYRLYRNVLCINPERNFLYNTLNINDLRETSASRTDIKTLDEAITPHNTKFLKKSTLFNKNSLTLLQTTFGFLPFTYNGGDLRNSTFGDRFLMRVETAIAFLST